MPHLKEHRILPATRRAALALLLLMLPVGAGAAERVVRLFDEQRGLYVAEISSLAQDSSGFLWIGTIGGLTRFDGRRMRAWAPDSMRHVVSVLAAGPGGEVVAGGYFEPLYRVTQNGVERVPGPDGGPLLGWRHATIASDGALWVVWPDRLARRGKGGEWRAWRADSLGGGEVYRAFPAADGAAYVSTSRALLEVSASGAAREVAKLPYVRALARRADSSLVVGGWHTGVHEIRGGRATLLLQVTGSVNSVALRGDRIWASVDEWVVGLREGDPPDTLAPGPGVFTGRSLLVDREGSLWIGAFRGLEQLPEPETVTWNDGDGMTSPPHARFVMRNDEGAWVASWSGLSLLHPAGKPRATIMDHDSRWRMVRDPAGRLWNGGHGGFHERVGGRWAFYPVQGESLMRIAALWPRRGGNGWLSTSTGLFMTPGPGVPGPPRVVPGAPPPAWGERWRGFWVADAIEDARGTLWVTNGDDVAHANADSVARGLAVKWTVETPRDVESCDHLWPMPSGEIWLGTGNGGVRRRAGGTWEEVPATSSLASRRIGVFTASPRGGVWLSANGSLLRVEEAPNTSAGWRVLERLSSWEGLPYISASEVIEDADGTLWIPSLAGLTVVPPAARSAEKLPPPARLVDLVVDGQRLALGPHIELPFRRNRLELHFAALSYRDPNLVRYQIRLKPGAPWTESREPDFRFVDLAPGRYHAEVRASLDGEHWSDAPTHLDFTVHRPWYLEPWVLAALALAAAIALYAGHRVRVAFLLRLERQRARIAMDLHDEMGSGLGSIGLLAGLAAERELDDASRRDLAERIAEAAGDLGSALSDIVWSLRADSGSLESLARRIAERARRLFPEERAEFATRFPEEWPEAELPLELRRNLQLIALEALHNASKHSGAKRVELGLAPEGAHWRLWVADDGCGLGASAAGNGSGHGLRNLRERAAAIGARIAWSAPAEGGTRVEVHFDPRAGSHHHAISRAR